ncbi:GNAT family N-acetyltransferase [Tropicimonas aquimaris]|uniref:GNAT family N-acetyltransferase n=1 Tax=Tropicimonas aquimaris TaxID=914152 RepID=A0ABW3ILB1_9RHOB
MDADWEETAPMRLPGGLAALPMQQHGLYGAACRSLGAGARRFVMRRHGQVEGAAQVLVRRWPLLGTAALLSRGPVWARSVPEARRVAGLRGLLERLRREHRCVVVTPEPGVGGVDPMAGSGWLPAVSACSLARLSLEGGPEALRGRMHGKWRNRLVRAEAAGLVVAAGPMPADPGHWLLRREAAQARTRGYRALPASFTAAWVAVGGPGSARLFTALRGDEPVAAMLFLLHPPGTSYHVGWSGPEGRAAGAHNLLLWGAMQWLAGQGVRTLDLDLLDSHAAPGLVRFKLGSGAVCEPLAPTRVHAPGSRLFAGRAA